jgi:5-methylcytosine-specific restriction enzyme B
MKPPELTRVAVEQAMDQCDLLGLDEFLRTFEFGRPRRYWVVRGDGRHYPAKATVGVACGFVPGGNSLSAAEFYGGMGEQAANGILTRLGYEIVTKDDAQADGASGAAAIRTFVDANYFKPAATRGDATVEIVSGDLHRAMGLNNAMPNVCQVLDGERLRDETGVSLIDRSEPPASSTVRYTFALPATGDWAEQEMARRFGRPIVNNIKMLAFELRDGRQIAKQRDVAGTQIWIEGRPADALLDYVPYEASQGRHSNLPARLKHQPPSQVGSRPVSKVSIENPLQLKQLLDSYTGMIDAPAPDSKPARDTFPMPLPTNLLLYGPPGTGKTFATAREAVRLCGEAIPEDRGELMEIYRSLVEKGRIGFVTFHQNFSYEDFVEGLRPSTVSDDNSNSGTATGFTLVSHEGVFQTIALKARRSGLGETSGMPAEFAGKRVFKFSLGREEDRELLQKHALEEGFIAQGWGGQIDWTEFTTYEAIADRWNEDRPGTNGNSSDILHTHRFRNLLREGDLVILASDNLNIDAIGEVGGPYQYDPSREDGYPHRRNVEWRRVFESPMPAEKLLTVDLNRRTIYELSKDNIQWASIGKLLLGANPSEPPITSGVKQFVLIIDEINRANISKVFGELITLIEPDKRLGMENALTLTLPYSKRSFGVPANLHILGTMNTADRSIALLDTALRRRFTFREMAPDPALLEPVAGIDLRKILTVINDRIEYLLDREHRIGHAYFMGLADRDALDAVMRDKVIPLLQEYFFEDWSRIRAVLGSGFIGVAKLPPPPGMKDQPERESWFVCDEFSTDAYARLVSGSEPEDDPGTEGLESGTSE